MGRKNHGGIETWNLMSQHLWPLLLMPVIALEKRLLARVVFSSEDGYDHVLSEANMFECTESTEQLELKAPVSDED